MRKDKYPSKGLLPVEKVSEAQVRRSHAELADGSDQLPELDLHGKTAVEAVGELESVVAGMNAAGELACRIVHGVGKNILAPAVARRIAELTEDGIIETSFPSPKTPAAAIVVVFCP